MKSTCKTCGKKCEGDACFAHKPRKALAKTTMLNRSNRSRRNVEAIQQMQEFFLDVWKKRKHYSEISGFYLGKEPLSVFFHHILPKEKFPQAAFDEDNIILLTLEEHTRVENDVYRYEEVNAKRIELMQKYERIKQGA